jgi:hypothetical protein
MRTTLAFLLACILTLPLLAVRAAPPPAARTEAKWTGRTAPDGTEIRLDIPDELHQRNTGGSDGAGLCVYASARHSGRWHDEPVFSGMFDYMKGQPGGSYPTKFAGTVKTYARLKSLPEPHYLSIEGLDLDALELAVKNGYMPGVTVMNGAHMVTLVGAREGPERWWIVLDNNAPHQFRWYTEAEFVRTHTWGGKGKVAAASAWSVIPLTPGPPPVPRSLVPGPQPAPPVKPSPAPTPCPPLKP